VKLLPLEKFATPPSGLTVSNITNSTADLSWDAFSGASGYEVYVVGKDVYSTTSNSFTATGLPSGTNTKWAVRTNCGGAFTSWVWGPEFTTLSASNSTASHANLNTDSNSEFIVENNKALELTAYPNPSNGKVNISLNPIEGEKIKAIVVMNIQGISLKRIERLDSTLETLNFKEFGSGVYLIKVLLNNKKVMIRKIMIN
jgi:hypothetical protein